MSNKPAKRRVVITGYGMVTPLGRNSQDTFENASKGISGIDYITSFDTRGLPCQIGGQVQDSWLEGLEDENAHRFDKFSSRGLRLMRIATREAAQQANLDEIENRERIGVSLGSHGDNPSVADMMFLHRFYDGSGQWDMKGLLQAGGYSYFQFFRRKPDVGTTIISKLFQCKGSNLSLGTVAK